MTTTGILAEILGLLQGANADPRSVEITSSAANDPTVTIDFLSVQEFQRFVGADKAGRQVKIERRGSSRTTSSQLARYTQYSALYERPGRRMLVQHYHYQHCQCLAGDQR